jgi:hypothetical protein
MPYKPTGYAMGRPEKLPAELKGRRCEILLPGVVLDAVNEEMERTGLSRCRIVQAALVEFLGVDMAPYQALPPPPRKLSGKTPAEPKRKAPPDPNLLARVWLTLQQASHRELGPGYAITQPVLDQVHRLLVDGAPPGKHAPIILMRRARALLGPKIGADLADKANDYEVA